MGHQIINMVCIYPSGAEGKRLDWAIQLGRWLPQCLCLHACLCPLVPGLHIDPNNQQMQSALNDAMSAKNRPPAGEGVSAAELAVHGYSMATCCLAPVAAMCAVEADAVEVDACRGWGGGCSALPISTVN